VRIFEDRFVTGWAAFWIGLFGVIAISSVGTMVYNLCVAWIHASYARKEMIRPKKQKENPK
jgi:hypothetical protein